MNQIPEWLPALVCLPDYGDDWQRYLDALYGFFRLDFIESQPLFGKRPVGLKRHPLSNGKEATFWHLISEGRVEAERVPDLRRCERIRWPRPMIEAIGQGSVLCWRNIRGGETRVLIALPDFSYVVVLADRRRYVLLWTAYQVEHHHRRRKLEKDWRQAQKC
jgi:hypothetical protein